MKKYENGRLIKVVCNQCGREIKTEADMIKEGICSVDTDWGYFSGKDGSVISLICARSVMTFWLADFVYQWRFPSRRNYYDAGIARMHNTRQCIGDLRKD